MKKRINRVSLGRRRRKEVHLGCPFPVLSPPLSISKEAVSVAGSPGISAACVPSPLQDAAPCPCSAYLLPLLRLFNITSVTSAESNIEASGIFDQVNFGVH